MSKNGQFLLLINMIKKFLPSETNTPRISLFMKKLLLIHGKHLISSELGQAMAQYISIDFSVYAQTNLGEEVFISGNIEELGSWNPNLAMKLQTSKDVYP